MNADETVLRDVKLELAIMAGVDGIQYANANQLSQRVGYNAMRVGRALSKLREDGHVSVWSDSSPKTYRIDFALDA